MVNVRRWNVVCQHFLYIPIVQLHGGHQLNWLFVEAIIFQGESMKKIIVIGDSNQTSLVTLKLAFLLSCPVYSGEKEKANRGYCSSADWPNSIFPNSAMELRFPKVCQKYGADQDTILGKISFWPLLPFFWPAYKIHTFYYFLHIFTNKPSFLFTHFL